MPGITHFAEIYKLLDKGIKDRNLENIKPYNYGMGEENETTVIHRNEFSPASSILEMTLRQKSELGKSNPSIAKDTVEEKIQIRRLDNVVDELRIRSPYLVKIDTEGYEIHVLRGGAKTISNSAVVIIETSLYELYKCQPSFIEICYKMSDLGFFYGGSFSNNINPEDGLIPQQDSIFLPNKFNLRRLEMLTCLDA